jgi:hypothetical protein
MMKISMYNVVVALYLEYECMFTYTAKTDIITY